MPSAATSRSASASRASWRTIRSRLLSIAPADLKKLVNAAVKRRESNARRSRLRSRLRSRSRSRTRPHAKDIGVFGYANDEPASNWLATDGSAPADPACMLACVEHLRGRTLASSEAASAPFTRILDDATCTKLIAIVDHAWKYSTATVDPTAADADWCTDYKLPMSASVLETTIGEAAFGTLQNLLDAEPDDVVIRRTQGCGQWINFHVDEARTTIQVPLRSDDAGAGGRLMFIGPGGEPVCRPRQAGIPLVHDGDCVHGVTRLGNQSDLHTKRNVRYGLFLRKL